MNESPAQVRLDRIGELQAENERLRESLEDRTGAHRIAGDAADRFRDVLSEVLGLDENPGGDALVAEIRRRHGKDGPEPRRWRDSVTAAERLVRGGLT